MSDENLKEALRAVNAAVVANDCRPLKVAQIIHVLRGLGWRKYKVRHRTPDKWNDAANAIMTREYHRGAEHAQEVLSAAGYSFTVAAVRRHAWRKRYHANRSLVSKRNYVSGRCKKPPNRWRTEHETDHHRSHDVHGPDRRTGPLPSNRQCGT